MKIEFEGHLIACNVQYSKRKKISLHMDAQGLVTVKVPNDTSEAVIIQVVKHYGQWIIEKSQLIAREQETPNAREYAHNGRFLHLGKEYDLHELIDIGELSEEELKNKLKRFYFASCKRIVGERIKRYQLALKVKPKSFDIVESRTKWGSCSSDKKLTFNYRLAMAPIEVIDYVIIHELCHLHHMNHDRSFWRRVGSVMPDYKEKEAYLAKYGQFMTI